MGGFQNNSSIGWVHPKSTHACSLAWANKKFTSKPVTLFIQSIFDSSTPIPTQKMLPLPPINHNITTTYILRYKDTLSLKYLQILKLKKYGVLRRRVLSLSKKMVATMSRNRMCMQFETIKHTSKAVHLLTFLKGNGGGGGGAQGGSVMFLMCSPKMFPIAFKFISYFTQIFSLLTYVGE
jgi:hypothetical protein